MPLAHELAEVQLALGHHRRRAGVAEMRVVRPDDDLGLAIAGLEMGHQRFQRLGHVPVTEIPGRNTTAEHGAVIRLRVLRQPRILRRKEVLVLGHAPIAPGEIGGAPLQLDQLPHRFVLARLGEAERRGIAVDLGVVAEVIEAGVAGAGANRALGVDLVEVAEHGLDGRVQAVEVEAVESDPRRIAGEGIVVVAQPLHEVQHVGVAPHPAREALEVPKRRQGVGVVARPTHVAIDPVGIGPVRLDGHRGESPLRDEPPRDARPLAVELVGAVGRFADQDEPRVPDQLEQPVIIILAAQERGSRRAHRVDLRGRPGTWPQPLRAGLTGCIAGWRSAARRKTS